MRDPQPVGWDQSISAPVQPTSAHGCGSAGPEHRPEQAEREIARLRQQVRDLEARQRRRLGDLVSTHERERLALATDLMAARRALDQLSAANQQIVQTYVQSTSWRLTRPLRVATRLARGRGLHPPPPNGPAPAAEPPSASPPAIAPDAAAAAKSAMRHLLRIRLGAFLASPATLTLPRADTPDVTILIVVYNQAELTLACLSAIVETLGAPDAPAVDVVIVDNASFDDTAPLLGRVQGATIIRNEANLHFLHGVNQGAAAVRGSSVLLLNNDAILLPGSLQAALRTLRSAPDIGAVGGKVILPNGQLQEAGSIVWSSGACLGYGRGEDPADPRFGFQRDVDFCSGAFLLVSMRLWTALGGFDVQYAPAYYEEVDLCVRLWRSGFRVVFDPDANIVHYEFGSSASSSNALMLQATNHAVFKAVHADWLASRQADLPGNRFQASDTGAGWRLLLVLLPGEDVPTPVLGAVDSGVRVTVLALGGRGGAGLDRRVETVFVPAPGDVAAVLQSRAGQYRLALCGGHPELRAALAQDGGLRILDLTDAAGLGAALADPVRVVQPGAELPCSRPPEADFAMALPFCFAPLADARPKVGVFCHLFYPELAAMLVPYLDNIGGQPDLHVSTDTAEKAADIRAAFAGCNAALVDVRTVPNRGRDVAAKLVGFADRQAQYDVVLHIHGKRSDHSAFLAAWGPFLLEELLGAPSVVSSVLDAFARLPTLGMVASQHFEPVRRWIGWQGNFATALALAERMGIALQAGRALDFPSGSMFWARPAALRPLLGLRLTWDDFPEERGQQDHTLAHAIERLFFLSCEHSGHTWLKVADPLLFNDASTIVDIPTPEALAAYAAAHAIQLTGDQVLAVRPGPAPLQTQVPPGLARRLAAKAQ